MSYLVDNAMIDDSGQAFFPDSPEDARHYASLFGARPADASRFPWRCVRVTRLDLRNVGIAHIQCDQVAGHVGDHGARYTWSERS